MEKDTVGLIDIVFGKVVRRDVSHYILLQNSSLIFDHGRSLPSCASITDASTRVVNDGIHVADGVDLHRKRPNVICLAEIADHQLTSLGKDAGHGVSPLLRSPVQDDLMSTPREAPCSREAQTVSRPRYEYLSQDTAPNR